VAIKPIFLEAGAAVVLLPISLIIFAAYAVREGRVRAVLWLRTFGTAYGAVLASKAAFHWWGISIGSLGLYSVSSHAMLTAAIYPVLFQRVASLWGERGQAWGWGVGLAASMTMCVVLALGCFHTVAEVLFGAVLGLWVAVANRGTLQTTAKLDVKKGVVLVILLFAILSLVGYVKPIKKAIWREMQNSFSSLPTYSRFMRSSPAGICQISVIKIAPRGREF